MAKHKEMATVTDDSNHKRGNLEVSCENVMGMCCTYCNPKPWPFELDDHAKGCPLDKCPRVSYVSCICPYWVTQIEGAREKTKKKVATLELKQPTKLPPQANQTDHGMYEDATQNTH